MRKSIAMMSHMRFSRLVSLLALLGGALTAGCAAMTNPGVVAIPVRLLPPEFRGESVAGMQPIPLSLLGQGRPEAYRIDAGDTLGLWVEGILGERDQQPPIHTAVTLGNVDLPPAIGFPILVEGDGTISLPELEPLKVSGMTFREAENAVRRAYVNADILKPNRSRILVTLMRPRTYHVLVLREDSSTPQQSVVTSMLGGGGPEYVSVSRKGTGWELGLPAYKNDVLTALAKSGGLPGTDAIDAVIVERNASRGSRSFDVIAQEFQAHGAPGCVPGGNLMRIPLRVRPSTPLTIRPEDVVLHDGDVVYIQAREERLFFTGGLLPPGQHLLPRDSDLDVLEAIARVRGPLFNGAFNTSNLAGTMLLYGLGQPSPTLLTVVRRLPGSCGQISIRVDLDRAVKDARERLLVQGGDYLILQESPEQGTVRYVTQMVSVPFYYLFQVGPRLFTGAAFQAPGGYAPTTLTPMNFSSGLSHAYYGNNVNSSSGSSSVPVITPTVPITTTTGR